MRDITYNMHMVLLCLGNACWPNAWRTRWRTRPFLYCPVTSTETECLHHNIIMFQSAMLHIKTVDAGRCVSNGMLCYQHSLPNWPMGFIKMLIALVVESGTRVSDHSAGYSVYQQQRKFVDFHMNVNAETIRGKSFQLTLPDSVSG